MFTISYPTLGANVFVQSVVCIYSMGVRITELNKGKLRNPWWAIDKLSAGKLWAADKSLTHLD